MIIRPNLDILISKLTQVKEKGVDIILCTTARRKWVSKFLRLQPKFKKVFDKIFTRDNEKDWKCIDEEKYPLEYKATSKNINLEYAKPVTTFGYNQILFIDNSKSEELRLKILYELTENKLDKEIMFFTAFGFNEGPILSDKLLAYKKASKYSKEIESNLKKYIEVRKNDIGCKMMCSTIDLFIAKKYEPGLTLLDEQYINDYNKYNNKLIILKDELEKISCKIDTNLLTYTESEMKEFLHELKN